MVQDADTTRVVRAALQSDKRMLWSAVEVAVRAGVVHLRGRVHSTMERELARQAAESAPGVRAVVNELAVRGTTGRPDRAVEEGVRHALACDPLLVSSAVDVSVRDGVVHLGGRLTTYLAKWHAEEAAREVPGVRKVVSDIAVVPLTPPTDTAVASDILAILARHPRVELDRISVDVAGGIVYLRGAVSSRARRWLVEELASSVAGVREVVNDLAVVRRTD